MNVHLYVWQRVTAAILVPLLLVHLAIIFYAMRHGLSAADILSRTRGSIGWGAFYGVFVAVIGIHAAIGIRNILDEWLPVGDRAAGIAAIVFGFLLFALGFRAVAAVVWS